jgi:hypothetical protein
MARERRQYVIYFRTRVNDDRLARGLVPNDRAVALERSDAEDLMDHWSR